MKAEASSFSGNTKDFFLFFLSSEESVSLSGAVADGVSVNHFFFLLHSAFTAAHGSQGRNVESESAQWPPGEPGGQDCTAPEQCALCSFLCLMSC